MNAFCRACGKPVDCQVVSHPETFTLEGVTFTVDQKQCFCALCHEELFPDSLMDQNIEAAHDALRTAKGSIPVAEMKALLQKYNIGANPLSKLLGWGENTIDRQMKHTMPDFEHAEQLKRLFDPRNMANLLLKNGSRISEVAWLKASRACIDCLKDLISDNLYEEKETNPSFFSRPNPPAMKAAVTIDDQPQQDGYTIAGADYPNCNYAFSNPFDLLCVA